jgi:hypothetical protein
MPARKPDLKLVAPTEFQGGDLRARLGKAIDTCFSHAKPMKGWVLISLHDDNGAMTAWDVKDSFLKPDEVPEMIYHILNDRVQMIEE